MTRDELILRTRQLVAEGERLAAEPSMGALQLWLQLSDDLLSRSWGSMDRYHLAWLMVGKPKAIVRGRPMTADEEAAYVREVASQKSAALRMSLDAVERQGMPFLGETGGIGSRVGAGPEGEAGASEGEVAAQGAPRDSGDSGAIRPARDIDRAPDPSGLPSGSGLAERLEAARREAEAHRDHGQRRAPRPDRMQR